MKKLFILFAFVLGTTFSSQVSAQLQFGAGIDLWLEGETSLGLQGKAIYSVNDKIGVNGSFSYFLSDYLDYSLDVGVQYKVIEGETFSLSPLAGFDMTRVSVFGFGATSTSLQIGALAELPLGGMNLYVEPKIILNNGSGLVLAAGVLF